MALKITKASEPLTVERINMCLYAPPGLGKSSLAFTAEAPLLLDFDRGAHRAKNRKDIVTIESWADIQSISAADLAEYRTIILDTAGRALDALSVDIIRANPKMGNGGALSLKGFGELKTRFGSFLRLLNSFGKDVVLICHMDEQRNGDEVIERLDVQGGSKGEIYKSVDAMGRLFVRQGKRYLDFSPREGSFGKNPAQLPEMEFPDPSKEPHFLANTIALIKSTLNELSSKQLADAALMDEWRDAISTMSTLAEFNSALPQMKGCALGIRGMFFAAAKEKGFAFNKATGLYEESPVHA